MSRCTYGRALIAIHTGGALPPGYEYLANLDHHPSTLKAHDKFCKDCSVAEDSTNPDAAALRRTA